MNEFPKHDMTNEFKSIEKNEFNKQDKKNDIDYKNAKTYWDNMLNDDNYLGKIKPEQKSESNEVKNETLDKLLDNYLDDLKKNSEYPDTIPDNPIKISDLKKISPEENEIMRDNFDDVKKDLKTEWEINNNTPWPKYDTDVYSDNGKLIRQAGSDYDAHHIHPLGLGGKNEAENITPMRAEVHYDKQGIHSPSSPYSRMESKLGGTD